MLKAIKEDYPIMGVCFGNQLLARAFGGDTFKLKFGHRGVNQPVKYEGRVYITSQNHGFAVDPKTLPEELEVCMVNVNDGTVEGLRHKELPIMSAQYHPEASPGPKDTSFLFDEFAKMLEGRR
jgi:carbamoyl-phosphate synthase small subunit